MIRVPSTRAGHEGSPLGVAATGQFGTRVLVGLAARRPVDFLLTRPDRPRGRGRRVEPPPAKAAAERLGVPVLQPERLDGDVELPAPTIVLADYGALVPAALLERHLWLNVHPSLLPRWRGAAPVERALMAGDEETGVTIIRLVEELDAGPIAAQRAFPIAADDDAGAVYERAADVAVDLLDRVLAQDEPSFAPQPDEGMTYAEKIRPADREVDLDAAPEETLNRIRALSPHIGARTTIEGRPVIVWRAHLEDGRVVPDEVQPEGRRRMTLDEFRERPALTVSPARRAAFGVVRRVFEEDAYADRALRSAVEGLDERDRALAQRLAYGTVQRVRTLDHAIETLGGRPVAKIDPPVLAALRLGAYQLGYVDGVPRYAAVNESVELVRMAGPARAVPFANAVLRRVAEGIRPLLDALPEETARQAALRHSYPDWVAETWWRDLGPDAARALMRAQNEPAETAVRVNRRRADPEQIPGERDPDLPDARIVERVEERWLEEGLVWPQSRGSQLAGLAVGAREGERTLDLCAAPGGKATQLAGEVVAVEKNPGRARELRENVERLGATNVTVVEADGLALPPELTGFDRALVDAPCSGLGVLAARPDLRWRAEPLPELQLELLRAAAERVEPGGTVVYAVCTVNHDENEAVVDASGLEAEPLGEEWPRFAHPERPEFLRTLPHEHGTSGFFVARLRVP